MTPNNLCCALDKVYQCNACDKVFCQQCFENSDHTWNSGPSLRNFSFMNVRWWRCIQSHKYVAPKAGEPVKPLVLEQVDEN